MFDEQPPETTGVGAPALVQDDLPETTDAAVDAAHVAYDDAPVEQTAPAEPAVAAAAEDALPEDARPEVATDTEPDADSETELPDDAELVAVVEAPRAKPESPYDRPGRWYVVHTYAGYENKVKQNLASRVRSMAVEEKIFEVVIPMEDVIEFKGGRKHVVQRKLYPGYLYIRMELDDDSWYVVRNTPGVTGFVGSGARPVPLSRREVEEILGMPTDEQVEGAE